MSLRETIVGLGRGLEDICSLLESKKHKRVWLRQEWLAAGAVAAKFAVFFASKTLVLTVFYKRIHEKVLLLAAGRSPES